MSLSDSHSPPAEAIILGQPLPSEQPALNAKEGKVDTSNPSYSQHSEANEDSHGSHEMNGENHIASTSETTSNPIEIVSHPLDSKAGQEADREDTIVGQGSSTTDVPSHASQPSEADASVHTGSHKHAATARNQTSGEEKRGTIDIHNVNALLNLPPPLPFDLKVSNLWVGVPHRGPSS